MRQPIKALAAAGLLFLGMNAAAQFRPRDEFRSDRERQEQLLNRLRTDLSVVRTAASPLTGDRHRIDLAMEEVNSLQSGIDRNDYDRAQFDRTIRAVQEVVRQDPALTERSWDALSDDVSRLRVLENHNADWR